MVSRPRLLTFLVLLAVALFLSSIGTANAEAQLRAPSDPLVIKFLTTLEPPISSERLVTANLQAIGCPRDGQVGPQEAPTLPHTVRPNLAYPVVTHTPYM